MSPVPFLKKNRPLLLLLAAALLLFLVVGRMVHPVRVGDGSEYYAMVQAWQAGHRPWMTPAAYDAYQALFDTNKILGLVTRDQLANAFPALRLGATSDFNHFWFYSFLAFLCVKALGLLGLHLSAHQGFLALHFLLFSLTVTLAYRYFRWRGVIAVGLMLLVSPVFWFIDKAHTEFFTVCLLLSAMVLMRAERYLGAAACIALASTQNPSFALVACIPLFYRVVLQRKQTYTLAEVILLVITVLGVLAHPVYYFLRFGVPTPQLLAGGAALGANLSTFYVWILDPDLGLLPNWPLGLLVLLVCIFAVNRRADSATPRRPDLRWSAFALLYLLINFYAHSSTTNLNSGATPGLARYALWYLPLGFPLFLHAVALFAAPGLRRWAALAVVLWLGWSSVKVNDPRKFEQYTLPSKWSAFLQRRIPDLYNPPAEIFFERYSGLGENVYIKPPRFILGPDCSKMLVDPAPGRQDAIAPAACLFDQAALNAYANDARLAIDAGMAKHAAPYYSKLGEEVRKRLLVVLKPGIHLASAEGDGASILADGWSMRENWGVWSDGHRATLVIPCNSGQYFAASTSFTLRLKLRPFNKQAISISAATGELWRGPISSTDQLVELKVPAAACTDGRQRIVLDLPDAISPMKLMGSPDGRVLGVGLSSWEIVN